jgi:hypothetical protein
MDRRGGVARLAKYPLSDADIEQVVGHPVPILPYPDLGNFETIDQVFGSHNACIVLFPNVSPTIGHWCCLLKRDGGIEFFDPYGQPPEAQKDGMPPSRLEALDIDVPYLTNLFRASGKPVYYNTYPFQKDRASIATCGRHCAVRILYAPYSLDKYKAIIDSSGMMPDEFVIGVTYDKIKK